jgi:phosphatidylglycerol:prolipoprotein diacylglycerol transferase
MIKYPNIDPVIFTIYGKIAIRWYQFAYIIGVLCTIMFIKKAITVEIKKYQSNNIDNIKNYVTLYIETLLTYIITSIIFGARIAYVLLYDFTYYRQNLYEIFYIWQGGLSFHGGLVGIIISVFLFSSTKIYKQIKQISKVNKIKLLDLGSVIAPVGLFFGRIANFINCELFGREVNSEFIFATIFPCDQLQLPRHPSQLYEAFFEGLLLFCIMLILYKKTKIMTRPGLTSGIFASIYSLFRFFIEFFREPDIQLGFLFQSLTMGQIASIIMFIFAITWIMVIGKYKEYV